MDFQTIIENIKHEDAEATLYFTKRLNGGYVSYCPEVSAKTMGEIVDQAVGYMSKFTKKEHVEYNPTGFRDGTIEHCDTEYIGNYQNVIDSFDPKAIEIEDSDIDKLVFYCIVIEVGDFIIRLFRRITKFKRLSSKGIIAMMRGNRLNKFEGSLLGLDGCVDLVIANEKILILNHTSLERIFDLQEEFTKNAKKAIEILQGTDGIKNMEQFKEDCLNNNNIKKTLTRMMSEKDLLNKCFDNFDNVVNAITMFNLDLEVTSDGERAIIYNDKSQLYDILRLASDAYYKSIVQEKLGVDNKI